MRILTIAIILLASCVSAPQTEVENAADTVKNQTTDSIYIMQDSGIQKKKLIEAPVDTSKLQNSRAMRVLEKAKGN